MAAAKTSVYHTIAISVDGPHGVSRVVRSSNVSSDILVSDWIRGAVAEVVFCSHVGVRSFQRFSDTFASFSCTFASNAIEFCSSSILVCNAVDVAFRIAEVTRSNSHTYFLLHGDSNSARGELLCHCEFVMKGDQER